MLSIDGNLIDHGDRKMELDLQGLAAQQIVAPDYLQAMGAEPGEI